MDEKDFADRLKRLEDRLGAAQAARVEPVARGRGKYTQGSIAWRMVTELVVGMGLGLALGYGLGYLLGMLPLFLVVFVLLGFAAGVRTMLRTATEMRDGRAEGALLRGPRNGNDGPEGRD